MGVSLAIESAHNAHAGNKVSRATYADRVPVSGPWYFAMNAGNQPAALSRNALQGLMWSRFSRRTR
jgi:hypothetical protein